MKILNSMAGVNEKHSFQLNGNKRVYSEPNLSKGYAFRLPWMICFHMENFHAVFLVTEQKEIINQGTSQMHWWGSGGQVIARRVNLILGLRGFMVMHFSF